MESHLPPQPPPDAPAPPPGPEAIRSRQNMGCMLWTGGISVVFALLVLAPLMLRSKRPATRTEAILNAKHLNLALIDFEADYGRFPDDTTIASVRSKTHTTLALGTSTSNDYFRQLIANDVTSEKIFWAKTPATPRKPNDILGPDALKKGECSFAYLAGLTTASDPATPVAVTPMIPGTHQFDSSAFGDKALILRVDGSVKPETIRNDNHEVWVQGGRSLFDTRLPYWNGKRPDLKWPE